MHSHECHAKIYTPNEIKDNGFAYKSTLFDVKNPFFVPMCNALSGISGYPDLTLQTQTTDAGFHSEDQTFAIGSDGLRKTYDLTLSFKDIQYGPIMASFYYWLKYIENVTRGTMSAYADDIFLSLALT